MLASTLAGVPHLAQGTAQASVTRREAAPVEVRQIDGRWVLLRGGEPYHVNGVGGTQNMELLAAVGGNSVRTWGVDDSTIRVLDRAHELGLTVTVGIWMESRGQGGDYSKPELREKQLERVRTWVPRLKDHPALLIWGIGNESEVRNNVPEYWQHLNEMARLCKELDPNHPTMHVTAEAGGAEGYGARLREFAPAIDIWGINSYRGMFTLRQRLQKQGFDGPYMVTEFGATGAWESPTTEWGAPLEQSSTEKAAQFARLFQEQVHGNPQLLGTYAFHWVQRPNPSHTWFSLLRHDGRPVEVVDTLQRQWTGRWPDDLGPRIHGIESPVARAVVRPDVEFSAEVKAFDPEGHPLQVEWMIRLDRNNRSWPPGSPMTDDEMNDLLVESTGQELKFRTPRVPDRYRLLVFVTDPGGKVATASEPFYVSADGILPEHERRRPPATQPQTPITHENQRNP